MCALTALTQRALAAEGHRHNGATTTQFVRLELAHVDFATTYPVCPNKLIPEAELTGTNATTETITSIVVSGHRATYPHQYPSFSVRTQWQGEGEDATRLGTSDASNETLRAPVGK